MKFEQPPTPVGSVEELEGSKKYEVNGEAVNVAWKIYQPKEKGYADPSVESEAEKKAVVFMPGWSINERAQSIETLCGEFADYSGGPAYAIDARTDNVLQNSTEIQAEAIRRFIEERGLSNVTLVGNSLGGVEAIHLTAFLQEDAEKIKIEGLVLLDSLSLYDQTVPELGLNYAKDMASTQMTSLGVASRRAIGNKPRIKGSTASALAGQNRKYLTDGTAEILKEVMRSGLRYPERMASELRQMTKKNQHLQDIKVPVVMIQGESDLLSNPEEIVAEPEKMENLKTREEFLKENLFTNAPHVAMVVPEKLGNHNVSFARPEEVARSSLYMLKRWNRQEGKD
ncbi:MAG TPA: alpha/beta hydrolase [Candidatus Paceibacterota bacterium]|nr:alpha/beta hydrolase [Candidatus Paceibacterota bacterium]